MDTDQGKEIDVTEEDYAQARRYTYEIWWSDEDNLWLGRVEELQGVMCHGASPEEALSQTMEVAGLAVAAMKDWGESLPPPRDRWSERVGK